MTEAPTAPSFLSLLSDPEALENAWLERADEPGPVAPWIEALLALAAEGRHGEVDVFTGVLAEALERENRTEDLFEVFRALAEAGVPGVSGQERVLARILREKFATSPWFEFLGARLELEGEGLDWGKFRTFLRWLCYLPGRVLMHRSGWGEGLVESLDAERGELEIRFANGPVRQIPWQTALETMSPLPDWDLRAMRMTDPEGLAALVAQEPLTVLRRCVRSLRGRASSTQIKEFLIGRIVPEKKWASFWRKAKTAAIEDPRISVGGSKARPVFELRAREIGYVEEAGLALRHERDPVAAVRTLRLWLERATRETDRRGIADLAVRVLPPLAERSESGYAKLAVHLFLEELGEGEPGRAAAQLAELAGDGAEALFARLAELGDPAVQRRAVRLLPQVFAAEWPERVAAGLKRFPPECLGTAVGLLEQEGRADLLVRAFEEVAPFPRKYPALVFELLQSWANGGMEAGDHRPDPSVLCRVALHALRATVEQRGGPERVRLSNRLQTLLVGRKGILARLLDEVDAQAFASIRRIGLQAGEAYPAKVQELIERVGRRRFPEVFEERQTGGLFWEDPGVIWGTEEGIAAFREEYRRLKEEKIPENAKAIGRAASYGDLSENAEWDAAMEEQRQLTGKASAMEARLKKARVLRRDLLPEGISGPGAAVTFTDLDRNERRRVRILGPFDTVLGDDVVSYTAPFGRSLCGRRIGDEVEVELPGGRRRLRIEAIEKL